MESWTEFYSKYGNRFERVKQLLKQMNEIIIHDGQKIFFEPIKSDEKVDIQKAWMHLHGILELESDRNFFQSSWVPIKADEYEIFVDLWTDDLKVIYTDYFMVLEWFIVDTEITMYDLLEILKYQPQSFEKIRLNIVEKSSKIINDFAEEYEK